jgi:hypothetical protein
VGGGVESAVVACVAAGATDSCAGGGRWSFGTSDCCQPVCLRKDSAAAEATETTEPQKLSVIAPPARGRGVSTLLMAECSRGCGLGFQLHGSHRIGQSRGEAVNWSPRIWEASRAEIYITIGAVPGIMLASNVLGAIVACVVVFEEAKETHRARTFAYRHVSAIRNKMLVQGSCGVKRLAL